MGNLISENVFSSDGSLLTGHQKLFLGHLSSHGGQELQFCQLNLTINKCVLHMACMTSVECKMKLH